MPAPLALRLEVIPKNVPRLIVLRRRERQTPAVHSSLDSANEVRTSKTLDEGYGLVQNGASDRFLSHSSYLFPSGDTLQILNELLWRGWRLLSHNNLNDVFRRRRFFDH